MILRDSNFVHDANAVGIVPIYTERHVTIIPSRINISKYMKWVSRLIIIPNIPVRNVSTKPNISICVNKPNSVGIVPIYIYISINIIIYIQILK